MELAGKKIGIWGYGIVGKTATTYLHGKTAALTICDKKELNQAEQHTLSEQQISFCTEQHLHRFLEAHDYIIPSPGIDLRPYGQFAHKWMSELDLFATAWHKKIIAITGSVGKTTVTHLIGLLLKQAGIRATVGGNIGTGMLALIDQQEAIDYAVLELSSWQLERNALFAPDIAIWTTFTENHLDRHGTMQNYFDAKYQIMAHQNEQQIAIIPLDLMPMIYEKNPKVRCIFFCEKTQQESYSALRLREQDLLFYFHDGALHAASTVKTQRIVNNIALPDYSFAHNWIAISAILHVLSLPFNLINEFDTTQCVQPHRLELLGTFNGITVYNDSKSTTTLSTIASVNKFAGTGKRIHLILGGLSKGVDRTPLIAALKDKVTAIYCFGKEAHELKKMCDDYTVSSLTCDTLEEVVNATIKNCQPGDILLFSPAGSSYDLFKDYVDRGDQFKRLILTLNG